MLHSRTIRAALPAALLTCLALTPASADAAKRTTTDWRYDVTVRAELKERWSFHEEAHMGDALEPCDRYQDGAGSAKIQLRSRRPTRVMILRPAGKGLPFLDAGTGEGIPLTGTYERVGTDEERHEGPRCGPGNPPNIQPTSGCGVRTVKGDWTIVWKRRGTVHPQPIFDDRREDCPSGPPDGVQWAGGVAPHLTEVPAQVPPSKFYGTRQFTVRGSKTFTGIVPAINEPHFQRFGQAEATWQWEATYRLVSRKKQRKRTARPR